MFNMFLRTKSSKRGAVQRRSRAPPLQTSGRAPQKTKVIRADVVNPFVEADVIDLGGPRAPRRRTARAAPAPAPRRGYVPNPRLYPGPRRRPTAVHAHRPRRTRRVLRRVVPNPRLYRPPPPRPPPPPAVPRTTWPPPPPLRPHDTASRVALRIGERRVPRLPPAPAPATAPAPAPIHAVSPALALEPTRRLVVRLPTRYEPTNENFRERKILPTMEPASPEEYSGGDEPLSAPSEFLAEFLSAIMRQQYAEALKYCRLILQYEPHNATARSFHPLLLRKLRRRRVDDDPASSSDDSLAAEAARPASSPGGGSVSSQSSLELDSEPVSRGDRSSDTDTNGNTPRPPLSTLEADLNDNAATTASGDAPGATLRRLRAQFARSVK